ncbi:Inosose dehydratase [Thalassoglobus neptunius]|uniref:Inosose dehydratase n=1 Tax=Thalassoglobus neptunius TaxID=1938619 RepID=A0A5C5X7F5_9PLAN|nr:sugar phosphate isomerase/epimerase family protein [Thalassoglobus neptunius]TWT58589.1 Inosose dehydratase [Thalassoglobus neptunius]
MRPRISAFPKCYLDAIAGERSMTVFEWIELAQGLPAEGLEMYDGFFTSTEDAYIDEVAAAVHRAGFVVPMLCCSPDFTNPEASQREAAVQRQLEMIRVAHRLGGEGTVCRVLSGQRYPEVEREQGIQWVRECIDQLLPTARGLGIILGLENHYKDGFWKYPEFAQKQDVFLELLNAIPETEFFGVQYDPSNAIVAGDDPIELLRAVAPRVVSMHASDRYLEEGASLESLKQSDGTLGYSSSLKHGVTGKGLNDYDAIFSILASHNYTGWISIEDGMNGMDEMRESLEFLHSMVDKYFPQA